MHTPDITEWYNALIQLPDRTFFNLIRLYLGEISTPFNKQRLVERLNGFLHKTDIQSRIIQALDRVDILVLTAIHILPDTTRRTLLCFFSSDFYIHARLINMEERLLIYTVDDDNHDGEKVYRINPLLQPVFEPLLDKQLFFLPEKKRAVQTAMTMADDILLAGLYTLFLQETDVLKKDGSFKRKLVRTFDICFPDMSGDIERMQMLCNSVLTLGLCTVTETCFLPQEMCWRTFFSQKAFERKMYLAAAACGKVRRKLLHKRAIVLSRFFSRLDLSGAYTDDTLRQIYFYVLHQPDGESLPLDKTLLQEVPKSGQSFMLVDAAKSFGFLLESDGLWSVNADIFSEPKENQAVIADPSFELTVLPHTAIKDIFSLLPYLEPVSIQRTGRFEITRAASARCFENYRDAAFFIEELKKASANAVPQNIMVSVIDWYDKYTALGLYHGFVLSVAEEKRVLFKKNTDLNGLVYKELADGIYLLHEQHSDVIRAVLKSAGLDCTFYQPEKDNYRAAAFAAIPYKNQPILQAEHYEQIARQRIREENYAAYKQTLEAALLEKPFSSQQQRRLAEKIQQKLIICPAQLAETALDGDSRSVSALDFLGKIRMAETAISTKTLLEISFASDDHHHVIIGLPVRIEKNDHDAVLIIQAKMSGIYKKIALARISKMNMVASSLFS